MNEFDSRRWMGALAWKVFCYTICGALLCAFTGACWGVVFEGGANLYIGAIPSYPNSPPPNSLFYGYPGFLIGAKVGAAIGAVQGAPLFLAGAWLASPRERGLLHSRGFFWFLSRAVPAGQTTGAWLSSLSLSLMAIAYGLATGQPRSELIQSAVVIMSSAAPLGLAVGGIVGGFTGINRASKQRRREENARVLEHPGT